MWDGVAGDEWHLSGARRVDVAKVSELQKTIDSVRAEMGVLQAVLTRLVATQDSKTARTPRTKTATPAVGA